MAANVNAREDQQLIYMGQFDARIRAYVRSLITPELIEEHRLKPLGQHSDQLDRVLNYFRRPPKFGLYSQNTFEYQIIALPVTPGAGPEPLDEQIFTEKNQAIHAVFLKHVHELQEGSE
ncbi:MAG: hypothetical protein GXP16_08080 [Gammaproteobacteria bacterium]|nr:hypothetical protein [Gammaproteobacteria bacterium]